jgi:hypothetical protein
MRKELLILTILLSCTTAMVGQVDSIRVIILKDDASSSNFEKKYMFIGCKNHISSSYNGGWKFLKIETNNGKILKTNDDFYTYFVIPQKQGNVIIKTVTLLWRGEKYDTVITSDVFQAISAPEIMTKLDEGYLKDSLDIKYSFVEKETLKENERYQLGAFPPPIIVYNGLIKIGEIYPFTEREEIRELLKNGTKLHFPSFLIRDIQTDLTIGTGEFDYYLNK